MAKQTNFGEFEFLRQLTETPGVPGREERIRDLVLKESGDFWDETSVDAMGNLICVKKATKKVGRKPAQKVMLSCHMDEIGFYVRYIDDTGRIRLQAVGGFDTRNLFARNVLVQGKKDLVGVLNPGGKPIHMSSAEERNKIPQIRDFYVDLLLPKREVEKNVSIGDPVTLIQETRMIGDCIVGKCLDDRAAVWVGLQAIRKAYGMPLLGGKPAKTTRGKKAKAGSPYDIYFVCSTQEEVGLRGATAAAYSVQPDIGLAIDVTLACDTPGIGKEDAVTELGKGTAIKFMDSATISHRGLFDEFVTLAKKERIKYQVEILPAGGTDAGALQRSRGGAKAMTISIPTRNIHTVTETINKKDAIASVDLLAAWLAG